MSDVSYEIEFQNEQGYPLDAADTARLQAVIHTVLTGQGVASGSSLSVVITDNDAVAALNRQYRGIDAPTDVLSFPADMPDLPGEAPYLGDLIIAYPYTQAQAEREGHPLPDMLALLVIHGTLHLLGYDHDTPDHQRAMWAAQASYLEQSGIAAGIVPEVEPDE